MLSTRVKFNCDKELRQELGRIWQKTVSTSGDHQRSLTDASRWKQFQEKQAKRSKDSLTAQSVVSDRVEYSRQLGRSNGQGCSVCSEV